MEEKIIKKLIGKKVRIISDNENYTDYLDKTLKITHAAIGGLAYDETVYPHALCSFEVIETGKDVPFSLYEYEFQIL